MSARLLGRYDAEAVTGLFTDAGVLKALAAKRFLHPRISIGEVDSPLTHVRLYAEKAGVEHLLFDACLTEASADTNVFAADGYGVRRSASVIVIFWAREQDPTAVFAPDRPPLPLQDHPGLGVLKRVFRVGARVAVELEKDGIAAYPKFPHDAIIFFRSRLFLFLQAPEQGRLEALWRDLGHLGLRDFSLAVSSGAAVDETGRRVQWQPGLQMHPLTDLLRDHFHSGAYARAVEDACSTARYTYDARTLREAVAVFERSLGSHGAAEQERHVEGK